MKKRILIIVLCFGYLGFAQIIDTGGNIGVGTTVPSEKLHVDGSLLLDVFDKGNNNGIFFRKNYSAANQYNISILNYDHNGNGSTPDGLSINAFDGISFSTGANYRSEKMRITQLGYVGIATLSPKYRLDVNGTTKTKQLVVGNRSSVPDFATAWYEGANYANIFINETSQPLNEKLWTLSTTGGNFNMLTQTDDLGDAKVGFSIRRGKGIDIDKVLFPEGNVGIGTVSPSAKLDVKGSGQFSKNLTIGNPSGARTMINGSSNTTMYNSSAISTILMNAEDSYHKGGLVAVKRGDIQTSIFPVAMQAGPDGSSFSLNKFTSNGAFADGAKLISAIFSGDTEAMTGLQLNTSNSAVVIGNWLGYERNKGYGLINKFKTKFENDLYVTNGGSIGIGTASPNAKLEVRGNIRVEAPGSSWINGKTGTGGITSITRQTASAYHTLLRQKTSSGHVVNLGGLGDHFGFFGYDKDRTANGYDHSMVMDLKTGNVGIGTFRNGGHKLAVNGSVGAREVKVELTNWSDFVFYKDYKLPTLEAVEMHIKEKGHLKDIPSAKDVEEDGIYLGEMNAKLLQKIEELTLYTIQQEKKLTVQDKQLKVQQEVNAKLEARLLKLEAALLEHD